MTVGQPKQNASNNPVSRTAGFTLIELMVTVAIVAIVAAVAYPSYQGVMKRSYRSNAQADLMAFAASMERHYSGTFSYTGAAVAAADTGSPAVFASYSPASEQQANKRYDLTIEEANNTRFIIKATPVSGSAQAGDGALYYYSDGRKAWDVNGSGTVDAAEFCWAC